MPSRELPAARHEHRDIDEKFVWYAVATMVALLIACILVALWVYPMSHLDRMLRWPLANYPEPELQPNPRADMSAFYAGEMRALDSRGWDGAHRVAHIPIDEAMRQVAAEGIVGWPESGVPPSKPTPGASSLRPKTLP